LILLAYHINFSSLCGRMIISSLENPHKSHSFFSFLVATVRKREILSLKNAFQDK